MTRTGRFHDRRAFSRKLAVKKILLQYEHQGTSLVGIEQLSNGRSKSRLLSNFTARIFVISFSIKPASGGEVSHGYPDVHRNAAGAAGISATPLLRRMPGSGDSRGAAANRLVVGV